MLLIMPATASHPLEKLMTVNLAAVYSALESMTEPEREPIVETLLRRCDPEYDTKAHAEPWRNQVAQDLNQLLGHAAFHLEKCPDELDIAFAFAAVRIVERVAEFEQITEVDEKLDEQDRKREREIP